MSHYFDEMTISVRMPGYFVRDGSLKAYRGGGGTTNTTSFPPIQFHI